MLHRITDEKILLLFLIEEIKLTDSMEVSLLCGKPMLKIEELVVLKRGSQ